MTLSQKFVIHNSYTRYFFIKNYFLDWRPFSMLPLRPLVAIASSDLHIYLYIYFYISIPICPKNKSNRLTPTSLFGRICKSISLMGAIILRCCEVGCHSLTVRQKFRFFILSTYWLNEIISYCMYTCTSIISTRMLAMWQNITLINFYLRETIFFSKFITHILRFVKLY